MVESVLGTSVCSNVLAAVSFPNIERIRGGVSITYHCKNTFARRMNIKRTNLAFLWRCGCSSVDSFVEALASSTPFTIPHPTATDLHCHHPNFATGKAEQHFPQHAHNSIFLLTTSATVPRVRDKQGSRRALHARTLMYVNVGTNISHGQRLL